MMVREGGWNNVVLHNGGDSGLIGTFAGLCTTWEGNTASFAG
jgi:hypothetical protein